MEDYVISDYGNVCRLCLSKEGKKLAIFGATDEDMGALSARIEACLALEVSQTDELPKQICRRCECQVNIWHYFKLECESTQEKLKNWLNMGLTSVRRATEIHETDTCIRQIGEAECQVVNIKTEPEEEMIDITECSIITGSTMDNPILTPKKADNGSMCIEQNERPELHQGERISSGETSRSELVDIVKECDQIEEQQEVMDLLIMETSSVGLHSDVTNCSRDLPEPLQVLDIEDEDLVRMAVEDVDEVEGNEHLNTEVVGLKDEENDITLISEGTPSCQVIGVTLEDSNHRAVQPIATETVNVDMDLSLEDEASQCVDDPLESLGHVKKELDVNPWSCWSGGMKIKQEVEESNNVENVDGIVRKSTTLPCLSPSRTEVNLLLSPVSKSSMSRPLSSSTPSRKSGGKLQCLKCNDTFSTQMQLSLHERDHLEQDEHMSSQKFKDADTLCNFLSSNLPKISNELYDEANSFCKVCEKAFTKNNFWRHMRTHMKENPFKCNVCKKVFPGRRELVIHRTRTVSKYCRLGEEPDVDLSFIITCVKVSRGKMGRYKCRECGDKFGQLAFAKEHIRVHTGEKPFFCYKCNKKEFRLKKTAMKHLSVCKGHSKGAPIVLKGKMKPPAHKISKGAVVHCKTEKSEKSCEDTRRKCRKCRKMFATNIGLSNHLRTGCAGLSKCPSCSKMFSGFTMKNHMKHCCMKAASSSDVGSTSNLASSHSSTSTFSIVERKSIDTASSPNVSETSPPRKKSKLTTKIINVSVKELEKMHLDHEGKMTMTCKICDKIWGSGKSLQAHLLVHSAKAFRCPVCRILMRQKSAFEAHMKFYHNRHGKEGEKLESNTSEAVPTLIQLKKQKKKSKLGSFSNLKLKCELCLRFFGSAAALTYHKLFHKKVKCKVCEITFPATMEKAHICTPKTKVDEQVAQLNPDSVDHQGERKVVQYTCHLCKKRFHTRKMLYQHKKMHIKMKIYKCKMCGNSYSDAGALLLHKQSEHFEEMERMENSVPLPVEKSAPVLSEVKKELKEYSCSKCPRTYSSEELLNRHVKLHTGRPKTNMIHFSTNAESLICHLCDRIFANEKSFNTHRGWHSRIATETLKTPLDPSQSLPTSNIVAAGSAITTEPSSFGKLEVSFECETCHKRFGTLKNLRCHIAHHKKGTLQGKSQATLKSNVTGAIDPQNIFPQDKSVHKCKFCSKLFLELSSYKNHVKTHVTESSPIGDVPKISNDSVESSSSFNEHQEKEMLKCKLCNKEYKSRKGLKHHILGHSGEKPYKCKSCSNQYSSSKALNRHETEMHASALRPFSCNRCKASFILKEDLIAHYEKCTH